MGGSEDDLLSGEESGGRWEVQRKKGKTGN